MHTIKKFGVKPVLSNNRKLGSSCTKWVSAYARACACVCTCEVRSITQKDMVGCFPMFHGGGLEVSSFGKLNRVW